MLELGFDIKDRSGLWIKTFSGGGKRYITRACVKYSSMNKRCLIGGAEHKKRPSYIGCYTSENFKDFQFFVYWARAQIGYYNDGWHLDKDLLVKGNKQYSEDTCVFIPNIINNLLNTRKASRGNWPVGVTLDKRKQRFVAQISRGCEHDYIGSYNNPRDAFIAYKREKELYAKQLANKYKDQVDTRVYDALMNYTVEITD